MSVFFFNAKWLYIQIKQCESHRPFNSQKWLTYNFSLSYPNIIRETGGENTQTHQVQDINLDQTPNSSNQFTRKCIAARGRIDNQILEVKGLRHQEIVHLCLLQLCVQLNVHIWIWQLFFFLLSFYQFELCLWKLTNSNTQVCLGWMALFLVKRTTMKVKGVIV